MKNIIIVLLLAFILPLTSSAQRSVNRFIDKYYDKENVTTVELSGFVLKMAAKFVDDDEGKQILASISRLQVLAMDGKNHVTKKDLNALKAKVKKDKFEELMTIKTKGTSVDFFIKEENGVIKNILLLVSGKEEFVMLNLRGKLKFDDIQKLDFDVDGAEHFKKIPKWKDVPRA
jgi:hypothetical protein